jgi:hypothetical protein
MSDEIAPVSEEVLPPPEAAPAEPQQQQVEEAVQETAPEGEPEPMVVEEELFDIEINGKKHKVTKEIRDSVLMHADYTRKTQEVAEQRKAIEAQRSQVDQFATAAQAHIRDMGRLMALDDQLDQYNKVDWARYTNENPLEADAAFRQRTLMKEQREVLARQIQANEMRRSQEAQLAQAKRYEETNRKLADPDHGIRGWNSELAGKLRQYAADMGVSENVVRVLAHDVGAVKALHEAYLGRQLIEKQKAAAKAATTVDPKPLAKVGGQGVRNAVDLTRLSKSDDISSYVAARQKQLAHR